MFRYTENQQNNAQLSKIRKLLKKRKIIKISENSRLEKMMDPDSNESRFYLNRFLFFEIAEINKIADNYKIRKFLKKAKKSQVSGTF